MGILPSGWDKGCVASCLSKEGALAESGGRLTGVSIPKVCPLTPITPPPPPPPKRRTWRELALITPAWTDNTLKLGWWDTGDRAAFSESWFPPSGRNLRSSPKMRRGHHSPRRLAAHSPVPVPRGTCEQNFLLETVFCYQSCTKGLSK